MERFCGKSIWSRNLTVEENLIEMSECPLNFVQIVGNIIIAQVIIILLICRKCFRRKRPIKGCMFQHHKLMWNCTFLLFLCAFCLSAESLIVFWSVPSASSGNVTLLSSLLSPSSSTTEDTSFTSLYFSVFAPISFMIALFLASILYDDIEAHQQSKFLWINISLFLLSSILSWAKLYLYLQLMAGLTLLYVPVLANIFSSLATGILAGLLIHTCYCQMKKTSSQPVVKVDLKNVKYLHYYSTLLSRITFYWLTSLLWWGYRHPMEEEDLGELPPEESTPYQFNRFNEIYQKERKKSTADGQAFSLWKCMFNTIMGTFIMSGFFRLAADCSGLIAPLGIKVIVDYVGRSINSTNSSLPHEPPQEEEEPLQYLTISQLISNGYVMAVIILLSSMLQSTFSQCSTFLANAEGIHIKIALQALIYKKSLTLGITKSSQTEQQSSNSSDVDDSSQGEVEAATKETDDDKLDSRSGSSPGFDYGSISNLMSEDTSNIMNFFWNAHFIWAIPLKLTILMVLLYLQLGYSALIGAIICIVLMIPLQYIIIEKYMRSNSKEYMERCDERLRTMSEVLQGMKLLKLQGWELIFSQQVFSIRKRELKTLDRDMLYGSIMMFLTHMSSVVVTLVTFGLYPYIEAERLEPSKVFAGLALFNQLTVLLFVFPNTVPVVIYALESVRRVREFLLLPEATPIQQLNAVVRRHLENVDKKPDQEVDTSIDPLIKGSRIKPRDLNASSDSVFQSLENIVEDEENEDESNSVGEVEETDGEVTDSETTVHIRSGDFSWDEDRHDHGLTEISLKIPRGKLTVIVGTIGSGKSSLIFALLGEMRRVRGDILWASGTTIAYAGQKPWMLNASVRENITFGKQYKPRRYLKAVEACALQEDINILPEKDATEIGEKGINLSGGQKQRIAIARAIYSDAKVVILDDPLSALDVDVAHHVFDTGIRKFLLRSKRTVVLVTHHLPVLHHAHHIVSMEKGRIRIQGTLADIKIQDPILHAEWTDIMTKKEAEIQKQQETKTAKERWSLLKLVSKIGLQFKHRNSDAGSWKVNDDSKAQLEPFRKRKGTFSHYKNLSHDIFAPSDEYHDELMTPLLRRRCVSRNSRGSRTSSSSNKHPELVRMTSLQNDTTTTKTKSPLLVKKFQRLQSLPVDDEVQRPPSSPPPMRARAGTGDSHSGPRLKENMFRKMFHTKKPASVSSNSEIDRNLTPHQRLSSTVSGISEGDEEDEDAEETMLKTESSRDERAYGTIPMSVYLSYIAACGKVISSLYLLVSIGYEVIRVYNTFWLSKWSDRVSHATEKDYDDIMSYHFNIYVILSLVTVALSLTCNLVGKEAGANSREILHRRMLDSIVRCPMRFFDSTPTGRIITRFSSDMAFIDRKLSISMQRFMQFVFLCVSAIAVNAIVNPWVLLGAFPVIAIYFFIQRFFRFSSRELQRLEAISRGPIYSHFHETLEGLSTIRAYREQSRFTEQMLKKIEVNNRAAVFINVGNRWLSTTLDYLGSIIVFLATLASLVSSYFYPEVVTPSMVGLAISYILLVPVYLNQVVKYLAEVEMYMNSVERVNRYAGLESEDYGDHLEKMSALPDNWPHNGRVDFDNISVQYGPDRPPIITDLTLAIPPKQKVGICGRSGSGKSTLLMALFRISDISKGKILIDGVDVRKVPLIKLRSSLSIIPQENILFSGKLRFNLDPLNKTSDSDIWRALELCQMKDTVKDMPGQLDSEIKDGGATFSAGQKQLLGLTRAILHKSKVVIMDEATSSVDFVTERTLLEVVKEVFKDCTVLTIAHRLDTIVDGDRVIVLDAGKKVEDGHPNKLRNKKLSMFASMLRNADEQNKLGA